MRSDLKWTDLKSRFPRILWFWRQQKNQKNDSKIDFYILLISNCNFFEYNENCKVKEVEYSRNEI